MTNQELVARARELADAATPGPWTTNLDERPTVKQGIEIKGAEWWPGVGKCNHVHNATFIAESRSLLPKLATAVEEQQALWLEAEDGWAASRALNARLVAALTDLLGEPAPGAITAKPSYVEVAARCRALLAETEKT